ncbi:MAG: ABC transporter permease [Candidatus Heimdallarchaeota archaeon]|nr:ABC transporter permease [Candidatus Heimdallarchaeota archaeon]
MTLQVKTRTRLEPIQSSLQIYLNKNANFFNVIKATVQKDLVMKKRYKADLIGDFIRSFMFIGVFALFANAYVYVDIEMDFNTTLLFYLCAFMFIIYDSVTLWTPLNSVANDLYNGTLEYLYSSPNSRLGYFIGNIIASAIISSVVVIPIALFLIFYFKLAIISLLQVLGVLFVTLLVLVAFGVVFALLGVKFRKITSLAGILSTLFQFMSGFIFPVQAIPAQFRIISYILPYTYGIDLMRYYAIPGWIPLFDPTYLWLGLILSGILLWLSTIWLIKLVERHAKINGLHLI